MWANMMHFFMYYVSLYVKRKEQTIVLNKILIFFCSIYTLIFVIIILIIVGREEPTPNNKYLAFPGKLNKMNKNLLYYTHGKFYVSSPSMSDF